MAPLAIGSLGISEIAVILVVAVLIWGRDLPRVLREAGRYYSRIKSQLFMMRDEIERAVDIEDEQRGAPPALPPAKAPPPAPLPAHADLATTVPLPPAAPPAHAPPAPDGPGG